MANAPNRANSLIVVFRGEITLDITDYYRGYRQRDLEAVNPNCNLSGGAFPPRSAGGRNDNKTSGATGFDTKLCGGGETRRISYELSKREKHNQKHCQQDDGKLDYKNGQPEDVQDVCHFEKHEKSRNPEGTSDSCKSEEEAATTIQAIYRGYKTRRKFDEIRKSMSEEKQCIRKVAELLAIPMNSVRHKTADFHRILSKSPTRRNKNEKDRTRQVMSLKTKRTDSTLIRSRNQQGIDDQTANSNHIEEHIVCNTALNDDCLRKMHLYFSSFQSKTAASDENVMQRASENVARKNSVHQCDHSKFIETIKSPAFSSNLDERTSSISHSDNTDTDNPFCTQADRCSMTMGFNQTSVKGNIRNNNETDGQIKTEVELTKTMPKDIQNRPSNSKRPLPQRISSSILCPNANAYFFDNSLFFRERESILVFGGVDPHKEYEETASSGKDVYRFKPDENIWELVGEIPEARHHHSVAYLKGRIYIVGGADPKEDKLTGRNVAVETVWSFDPTTRTWFNEPGMLTARKNFGLVVSHGKMYAMGGQNKNGLALKTVETFDPIERTWKEVQPMHTARIGPASVKYRDLIWIGGGMTKSKKELFSKDVECYDPMKNLWLKALPLRSPRCFASFYVVSDRLYLIGGASVIENETQSIPSIDIWDATSCVWRDEANMTIPRHGHCIGSIGDQLLIIGGVTTTYMKTLNSAECYCCHLRKWIKGVAELPYPITGHGVLSLPPANLLTDR